MRKNVEIFGSLDGGRPGFGASISYDDAKLAYYRSNWKIQLADFFCLVFVRKVGRISNLELFLLRESYASRNHGESAREFVQFILAA
jgi:hypothetical protein